MTTRVAIFALLLGPSLALACKPASSGGVGDNANATGTKPDDDSPSKSANIAGAYLTYPACTFLKTSTPSALDAGCQLRSSKTHQPIDNKDVATVSWAYQVPSGFNMTPYSVQIIHLASTNTGYYYQVIYRFEKKAASLGVGNLSLASAAPAPADLGDLRPVANHVAGATFRSMTEIAAKAADPAFRFSTFDPYSTVGTGGAVTDSGAGGGPPPAAQYFDPDAQQATADVFSTGGVDQSTFQTYDQQAAGGTLNTIVQSEPSIDDTSTVVYADLPTDGDTTVTDAATDSSAAVSTDTATCVATSTATDGSQTATATPCDPATGQPLDVYPSDLSGGGP